MNTRQITATRLVALVLVAAISALAGRAGAQPATSRPAAAGSEVSAEQSAKAEAAFEAGRVLFFKGDYAKAIAQLDKAVEINPAKGGYRLLLAKAYRLNKQDELAAGQLSRILQDTPGHVEAGVELAEILLADRQYDRVIAVLEPLLKFRHDYPLYHMLAQAHYQKEQMAQARKYYEEAVKLNPRSGDDFYDLANIYLADSRFAKAATAYEQARSLGVDSAVLHFKLASVYFNLRRYLGQETTVEVLGGKSGEIHNKLLLIDPAPGRANTFYAAPEASAIYQVRLAQQMGIELPQIKFLEANIWLNSRRYSRADAIYKTLEGKLDKADQALFWFYWSQAALGLEDYDAYLARLGKAMELQPEIYKPMQSDAYVTVARRMQQRGDNGQYIAYLTRAVEANPLSSSLHLTLGDAQWQLGDKAKAVQQYRLVLELEPDHADRVRLLNRIRENG